LSFDGQDFTYQRIIAAGLNAPLGVALHGPGHILVADTGNDRVLVLDRQGNLSAEYAGPNDGYPGAFDQPRGVLGAGSDIVVADTGNQRVVTVAGALPEREYAVYLPVILRESTPGVPACQELVENGGFELQSAWLPGETLRPARYAEDQARSGCCSVLLGLLPGEEDVDSYSSVQQEISLPAGSGSISLAFWHLPLSDLDPGDRQECLLLDGQGGTLEILMRENNTGGSWVAESYDLSAYAGQTVRLYFNAYNDGDGGGVTGFYLDDVSLVACPEH
jgi:hypothetical protein